MESLLFLLMIAAQPVSIPTADSIADELIGSQTSTADLSVVDDANRAEIIARARSVAKREKVGNDIGANILLLRLGDIETMQRLMNDYHQSYGTDALERVPFLFARARQPLLIPLLASDLYLPAGKGLPPPIRPGQDVIVILTLQASSANLILENVIRSTEFDQKLRVWAKKFQRNRFGKQDEFVAQMKTWWEQNQKSFEAKNYAAVAALK